MLELRPYQVDAVRSLRAAIGMQGHQRVLLQAPTGAGKTVVASEIMRSAYAKNSRTLFIAHRRELIYQCSEKLQLFSIPHAVVLPNEPWSDETILCGSIQSFSRRVQNKRLDLEGVKLIIVDEAHHARAKSYQRIVEACPEAVVLGITATPIRGDGKGLGNMFSELVQTPTISELTEMGYLVPARYFAPTQPDLSGVRVRMGDYVESDLEKAMDKPQLVGDIVEWWGRIAPGKKTLVYASSVNHSKHLNTAFNKVGVGSHHLDGSTPNEERDEAVAAFRRGELQVLCNCMLFTEGTDIPDVEAIVLARPTKSIGLYLQIAGRGLRPADGKGECLLVDHAGAVHEHGFVTDWEEWTLETDKGKAAKKKEAKVGEYKMHECKECHAMFIPKGAYCPHCGAPLPQKLSRVELPDVADGELAEITGSGIKGIPEDKTEFYAQLKWVAREKRYSDGWVAHAYKDRFGVWPKGLKGVVPKAASPAVLQFVKRKNQRFARQKKKQGEQLEGQDKWRKVYGWKRLEERAREGNDWP